MRSPHLRVHRAVAEPGHARVAMWRLNGHKRGLVHGAAREEPERDDLELATRHARSEARHVRRDVQRERRVVLYDE